MTERKWADSTPIVPFGGYHGSGNDKTQFELIVELERAHAARDAELAEVKRDLAASVVKSAEFEAENSKLRSALEIVHFKREPWQ